MVGAVLAELARLVVPTEGLHGVKADKAALEFRFGLPLLFHVLLGEERDTDGAHFARTFRTDGLKAGVLLEGAENGVVLEGTALHHHLLTKGVQVADTDHLRKHVVDDGAADTRDNVFGLLAVALFRDDGTVHEHGAAATQLGRALGVERQFRNLFHGNAEAAGVGLDKGAATRGAGLVQDDTCDHAVLHGDSLHVLTADVQDEAYVGADLLGGVGMGHRFHRMVVGVDCLGEQLLAIACGTHTQNVQGATVFLVAVAEFV